jgi:hypothetical protein
LSARSTMDCPRCGQQPAGPRADDVTHNTLPANFYISTETFLEQLGDAVNGAWLRRHGAYIQVTVLLLSWQESDMKYADQEIARLQSVLEDPYHYTVENWKIPSVKPRQAATRKYLQFAEDYGASDSLLIVYYAGHARATSGQSPIWHSRADGGYELDSTAILSQLATPADDGDDAPDILLIQDCCHPLSAYRSQGKPSTAVVECLYSGGFESRVPIAGPESFTAGLTNELGRAFNSKTPITVTELHSRLIHRFEAKQSSIVYNNQNQPRMRDDGLVMTREDKITPSHTFLAPARPPRSIMLSLLPGPSRLQDDPVPSGDSGISSVSSWPVLYREWKSQARSKASKPQDVLFDIFYQTVRDGPEGTKKELIEQMDVHQVLSLSTHATHVLLTSGILGHSWKTAQCLRIDRRERSCCRCQKETDETMATVCDQTNTTV